MTGFKTSAILHAFLLISSALFKISHAQTSDEALTAQRNAETRAAIAEAERTELLARLPPATSSPCPSQSTCASSAPPA